MASIARTQVRVSGILEGISFLLLLGVAMPLKYYYAMPDAVRYTGMAHGLLFIWYVSAVMLGRQPLKLTLRETIIALLAAFLPFGTFYADSKIFRRERS